MRTANKLSKFMKEALVLCEFSVNEVTCTVEGRMGIRLFNQCSFVMKVSLLAVKGKNVY